MNKPKKKLTFKEIVLNNKYAATSGLIIILMCIFQVLIQLSDTSNLDWTMISLSILMVVVVIRDVFYKGATKSRYVVQVEGFLETLKIALLLGIVYVFYLVVLAFTNSESLPSFSQLGKDLLFIFHAEMENHPNRLMAKILLSIFVICKVSLWLSVIIYARKFLMNMGESYSKFTQGAAKSLRYIGYILIYIFLIDLLGPMCVMVLDSMSASTPDFYSQNTSQNYMVFAIGWLFGFTLVLLSNLIAHGVELQEEIEGTI